jgi:hypothetical protein
MPAVISGDMCDAIPAFERVKEFFFRRHRMWFLAVGAGAASGL